MISVVVFLVVIVILATFVLYLAFTVASKNNELDTLNDVVGSLKRQHDKIADSLIQEQDINGQLRRDNEMFGQTIVDLNEQLRATNPVPARPTKRTSGRKVANSETTDNQAAS